MGAHIADLLGAWALDACDDVEAAEVEAHIRECLECATEAKQLRATAAWLGIEQVMDPPPALRKSVLDRAWQVRPPSRLHTLVGAYAAQVDALRETLHGLTNDDWRRPDPRHGDLIGLLHHLTGNDAQLAVELKLPVIHFPREHIEDAWQQQAQVLIAGLGAEANLDRIVVLAGKAGPSPGTLHDALVQRAFETWIHHEDVLAVRVTPPPEQVRRIIALAVALLPTAVAAQGISAPGMSRLVLSGSAGGQWTLPFGEFTVRADAVDFARLVANRRTPEQITYAVDGDRRLAAQVLRIASTLGCD